jgi:hypothetical protein
VIAHELGHGTFRLYHTFSEKNDYLVPRGTTDNLMDYNQGKELHKYQWDLVQDPQGMWFTGLIDEEEAAYVGDDDYIETQEFIRLLRFVQTEDVSCNIPDDMPSTEDITIGNNVYEKIETQKTEEETGTIEANDNIVRFGKIKIITKNSTEASKLMDFITGEEKNIYGTSENTQTTVTLNGKTITFNDIVENVENRYITLLESGKYNELTEDEKTILDIPIIQWKLGFPYGAAFMDHWFEGSGKKIKLTNENYTDIYESSSIFQDNFNDAVDNKIENSPYNTEKLEDTRDEVCNKISKYASEGETQLKLNIWPDYQSNVNNINRVYAQSIDRSELISGLSIVDEDIVHAIGRFTIGFYFEGSLELINNKEATGVGNLYYRIWDTFDFSGKQLLGSWKRDVFDCEEPNIRINQINNNDFPPLFRMLNDSNNKSPEEAQFDIVTKYYKVAGSWLLDYSSNSTNCNVSIEKEEN